ncbi:hypothetical protein ACQ4PT_040618 [Festuca glaucescens]
MGGPPGAGGDPKLHTDDQEQEELVCYLPVDFSALLSRRQQFVEEIRHKRFRPKKRFRPNKKKGSVLLGLPSWLFADANDNSLSTAVTTAGASGGPTGRFGDCPGDCEGDSILPAAGDTSTSSGSTELIPQGRFWVLAAEDQGSSSEVEEETGGSESAFRYLCRSPSPDDGRDLIESASGLARRAERRLERQRRQRLAAREFSSPSCKAPKPSVTMYGYAIEQLMFFELPTGGTYKPKVDNVKLVKVTVEEKDKEGTPFKADPAPGSVMIRPASAPGSERLGAADSSALPLGSQSLAGATAVAAASSPGEASPPTRRVRSPLSPTCHQVLSATERAAAPVGCMAPAVELGMATVSPSCTPEKILPVPPALSHVTPTVVGPGRDRGHLRTEEQHGSPPAGVFGSSAATQSMVYSVASKKNTGISIVVNMENSPSPTVVTRQFSGTPMVTVTDFEGRTKKTPLVNDVAVFGGIASPSLSVRASDRIRAQPNADATQMERAMQNVNLRQDFTSPDLSYLTCEGEDNAEGTLHVAEEDKHGDKELPPSCAADLSYRELEPENMVQIFSLTLPETYPRSVSIYGIFAIRDVLHPGRNYLFRRSRDNSITIHPGSSLPLINPCRGIYAVTRALLDVDLRIKHHGDDESADEKFVAGYFELLVECKYDMRFCQRLHDGIRSHVLDVDGRYIGWSIAATVIASAEVPYPCQVTFTAYTSGFDDRVTIFDGTCCEGEVQFRHVVALKVLWTLELCLMLDGMCYSHSFRAGVDSKPIKFGPVKALVVWSVMNRHRFWW